jgi:hypothetical protein
MRCVPREHRGGTGDLQLSFLHLTTKTSHHLSLCLKTETLSLPIQTRIGSVAGGQVGCLPTYSGCRPSSGLLSVHHHTLAVSFSHPSIHFALLYGPIFASPLSPHPTSPRLPISDANAFLLPSYRPRRHRDNGVHHSEAGFDPVSGVHDAAHGGVQHPPDQVSGTAISPTYLSFLHPQLC